MKRAILTLGLAIGAMTASPAMANVLDGDPLPRVEDPICPGVSGLEEEAAIQLIDRIRFNAERLGLELADPATCSVNMLVAFVDDGQEAVERLMRSQPRLFDTLSVPERRELARSSEPVRAWNIVVTRTRDGMFVPQRENLVQIPQATMWSAHSKIYVPTRQDVLSSVVLFDGAAANGLSVVQLADYAAMRSFAVDYEAYPEQEETILSLFEGASDRAAELTEADLVFLRNLYSGIPNLPGRSRQRSAEFELEG